jgi:hypothetical protein
MGAALKKYYEFVEKNAGLSGRMRLAVMTNVPSQKAADVPDTPDIIAKFKAAVKEITGKDAPA